MHTARPSASLASPLRLRTAAFGLTFAATLAGSPRLAEARGPYVVVRDAGSLRDKAAWTSSALQRESDQVLARLDEAGVERPDVVSVWTTFPTKGNAFETLYKPYANDVRNIGLAAHYGKETFATASAAPVRAMLWHNDVTQAEKRAAFSGTKVDGYWSYMFLLELSHLWGPAYRAPAPAPPTTLEAWPFHWSFWMDAGGSPAGGNRFRDNADGTFTVEPQPAARVAFSMLDLYLMGLATADEVPPVSVLEEVEVPAGVRDPMTKGAVGATSFPWFDGAPFTVKARKKTFTMTELVAANGGPRLPAAGPSSYKVAFVLVVPEDATDAQLAAWDATFAPIARALPARFADATRGRASLVVTTPEVAEAPATPPPSAPGDAAAPTSPEPPAAAPGKDEGCATGPAGGGSGPAPLGLAGGALALAAALRRTFSRAAGRGDRGRDRAPRA